MTISAEPWALDLQKVEKTYGSGRRRVNALRGVSLQVRRGEVFGLLGPNGAGKSTLVKIMMTVVRPTRAVGSVLGAPVGSKSILTQIGYLPEHHRFPRYLTGRQILEFFGALAGVDRTNRKQRAASLLDLVGMTAACDRAVSGYSKGMMQRIGVAQALMNDPQLVVLDEPTDGVDPIGRRDLLAVLRRLRDEGRTVFVNSHLLSELEQISDRVAIMVQGLVVRQGTIPELAAHRQWYEIDVSPKTAAPIGALLSVTPSDRPEILRGQFTDQIWLQVERKPTVTTIRIGTADLAPVQSILDRLRQAQCVIQRLAMVQPSLEDLFMEAVAAGNLTTPGVNAFPVLTESAGAISASDTRPKVQP